MAHILYAMIKTRPSFDSRKIGKPDLIHEPEEGSRRKPAALLGFTPPTSPAGGCFLLGGVLHGGISIFQSR